MREKGTESKNVPKVGFQASQLLKVDIICIHQYNFHLNKQLFWEINEQEWVHFENFSKWRIVIFEFHVDSNEWRVKYNLVLLNALRLLDYANIIQYYQVFM